MARIREEEEKNGRIVGATETSEELAEWCRLQQKNLSKLGWPKKKEWPHCRKVCSWQDAIAVFANRKRNIAICPDHQIVS